MQAWFGNLAKIQPLIIYANDIQNMQGADARQHSQLLVLWIHLPAQYAKALSGIKLWPKWIYITRNELEGCTVVPQLNPSMQISITADFALVFLHGFITMTCLILVFICEGIAGRDPEDIIADFGSWLIFSNVSDLTNPVGGLLISCQKWGFDIWWIFRISKFLVTRSMYMLTAVTKLQNPGLFVHIYIFSVENREPEIVRWSAPPVGNNFLII